MFHLRLKGRLWVLGGGSPSSAIMESLTSIELARLRFDAVERRGIEGCADGLESIAYATVLTVKWSWRELRDGAGSLLGWTVGSKARKRIFQIHKFTWRLRRPMNVQP